MAQIAPFFAGSLSYRVGKTEISDRMHKYSFTFSSLFGIL